MLNGLSGSRVRVSTSVWLKAKKVSLSSIGVARGISVEVCPGRIASFSLAPRNRGSKDAAHSSTTGRCRRGPINFWGSGHRLELRPSSTAYLDIHLRIGRYID